MNTAAGRRDAATDILKIIACFGVIIIHISGQGVTEFDVGTAPWYACTLWDSLVRFAVPVFFMCTGALMLSPQKELPLRKLYGRHFLRVFWILLFWSWAYYCVTAVGQYVFTGWLEPRWFLNSILQTLRFNHHLHLYYLQILLLLYAALPVLRAFVRAADEKELRYALALWALLGIAFPLLTRYPPLSWMSGMVQDYTINMAWSSIGYALLGYVLSLRPAAPGELRSFGLLFAAGFLLTFGGTVAASLHGGSANTWFMEGMSPGPALMAAGLFGGVRALVKGRAGTPRLARYVEATFCVYLIHHFFIMFFRHVGIDVTLFAPILEIPAETMAVAALSLAGWWVLSKIPFVNKHLI